MGRQKADADAAYTALKNVTAVVGQQVNIKKKEYDHGQQAGQ